jgi:hypothetical protein
MVGGSVHVPFVLNFFGFNKYIDTKNSKNYSDSLKKAAAYLKFIRIA